MSLNRNPYPADRNYLHEDEVFLPPPNHNSRTNVIISRTRQAEKYDHLQHHYHPDDYLIFPGEARPLGDFGTGKAPQRDHFGRVIQGEHATPKTATRNFTRNQDDVINNNPARASWGRGQNSRNFRRSLDENFNTKRDSGIGLQRHPSLSRRSMDNVLDCHITGTGLLPRPGTIRSDHPHRLSLDSAQKQRLSSSASYRMSPPKRTPQTPNRPRFQPKPAFAPGRGNAKRKSLSSDSDDPIVTDCSVSSGCSSGSKPLSAANNSHYEEPICRKPRHNDVIKRPLRGHNCNPDENDLEVQMITKSDGCAKSRHDTLGHPPYRPPTPPGLTNAPVAHPRSRNVRRSNSYDFYTPHEFPTRPQNLGPPRSQNMPRSVTGL